MMKSLERRGANFRRAALLAGILISIALLMHGVFGENGLLALHQKRRDYQSLHQQIGHLQQENQTLQKEVQHLKTDPSTIERYAREELHMSRQGEIIYMLPSQKQPSGNAALTRSPHSH
ncbi:MAG TPA: septum formation initiator family protein [Terriglobia bacterium]|nr:septum formation initiator family protein [Terriglobia bacterium]